MRKKIDVVAAIIIKDSRIFAAERGYGSNKGKWEFPGGKIEEGEAPEAALKREINEELDTKISVGELVADVNWEYPEFSLYMKCYICDIVSGDLLLKEHANAKWLSIDEIYSVDWLEADRKILDKLICFLQND